MKRGSASVDVLRRKKAHVAHLLSLGKSQTEAAEAVGVTRETISRWKRTDEDFARMCDKGYLKNALEKLDSHAVSEKLADYSGQDIAIIRSELLGLGASALRTIAGIMHDPDASNRDKLAAAKDILDRIGVTAPKEMKVSHAHAHAYINPTALQEASLILDAATEEDIKALAADTEDKSDAA